MPCSMNERVCLYTGWRHGVGLCQAARQTRRGATDRGASSPKHASAFISFKSCITLMGAVAMCYSSCVDWPFLISGRDTATLYTAFASSLSNAFLTHLHPLVLLCCTVARVCECGGGPSRCRFQVGASAHAQSRLPVPSVTVTVTGPEAPQCSISGCGHPMCWNARAQKAVGIFLHSRLQFNVLSRVAIGMYFSWRRKCFFNV